MAFLSRSLGAFVVVAVLTAGSGVAYGQTKTNVLDSDPLRARKQLVYDMAGVWVGLSNNVQGGTFTTACNCSFEGGAGLTLTAGALFERLTRSEVTYGLMVGLEGRSIEGRFQEVEGVVQRSPATGREYTVPITFRNVATASIWYATLTPYVKYNLLRWLYVRAGPSVGYVLSGDVKHTKELMSDSVTFPGGEVASVRLTPDGERIVTLEDNPIPDLQRLQLAATLGVAADLRIGKAVYLAPTLQYVIPFTTVSGRGTDFSIRSMQFLMEARIIL